MTTHATAAPRADDTRAGRAPEPFHTTWSHTMTEQPVGPHCGHNPNVRLTDHDRKAVADFKARLTLQAAVKPYVDAAAWEDGDPLMEVIAATVWKHCTRDDQEMPQAVCDDPRTIAAFAAAVARAHAAAAPSSADRAAVERVRAVLETEAVVGRSALEYRGLIVSALMAVEAHGTGTQQQCPGIETVPNRCTCVCEGCKHHCGAHNPAATQQQCPEREPLIGVQCSKQAGHEAHSDRPGRIWYPVADDTAQQQEPTDEDVVEAHRLALSFALDLGTGAPWDAIRDRAAELGAQQQPETEAPDELAAARATNQRLNYEKQRLESELAAYRRAVRQWEVSERGTYIPHSSLRVIGNACGVDILGTVRHLKHFERVEQAEAAIERVRRIHTRGRRTNACNDCGQSWPCEVTRALDEPAPVAQQPAQDEALREGAVARCDRALAGKTHPPHDWEPDPGNGLWHCPGDEPFAI